MQVYEVHGSHILKYIHMYTQGGRLSASKSILQVQYTMFEYLYQNYLRNIFGIDS